MAPSDAIVEAVSGSVGSVVALLATYPLKTIYTLQSISSKGDGGAALTVLDIVRKYKLAGMYSGVAPNVVESAAQSGIYFFLYSKLRHLAVAQRRARLAKKSGDAPVAASSGSSKNEDIGILASLLVPALAGIGNQLVTLPASVLATRIQAQVKLQIDTGRKDIPTSVGSVAALVLKEGGLGAFWNGLLPSMVLVANPAIQYMVYEQLLRILRQWKKARLEKEAAAKGEAAPAAVKLTAGEIFCASALAKIAATIVTYPLIVVKSRLQAGGAKSTMEVILRLFKEQGISGFFAGLQAKIFQTALNAALMLMLKEQVYTATKTLLKPGNASALIDSAKKAVVKA